MIAGRLSCSDDENRKFLTKLQRCLDDFECLGIPTIAKLRGFCIGGGLLLALCCDFRVASSRTVFSLPEIKLGLPILWGTKRITRVIGLAAAKELIYLGGRFKASEAVRLGLVHQVVSPDELNQAVRTLADKLIRVPTTAVALAKRIIHESSELSLRESQDLEIDAITDLLGNPETSEAFTNYTQNLGVL